MGGPVGRFLTDGRLHLQHGPIDLVIEAAGEAGEVRRAYHQAWACFQDVLATLVGELALLRMPVGPDHPGVAGPVARRMFAACLPYATGFITPMAAVAGAVADEVLAALVAGRSLVKAYVNDGGDIAIHLGPGATLTAGVVGTVAVPSIDGVVTIDATMSVRGIATSGWDGRSFSLGIADAVTVLACEGASADAAATIIANAVDVADPAIRRAPARSIDPDSDLGDRLVTVGVGALSPKTGAVALRHGAEVAEALRANGLIYGAVLILQGQCRVIGPLPQLTPLPLAGEWDGSISPGVRPAA